MSFTSPLFYVALVPAVAVFLSGSPAGGGRFIFWRCLTRFTRFRAESISLLLIVASAAVYALGLAIAKSGSERAKQAYMAAGVAAVVAVIVAFKAAGAWRGFLLPLGVSYYSFKLISYLIEVYWDDEAVERDPIVFLLFPAFFPQIVSGPIQRPEPFFAQMRDVMGRTLDADQVEAGFRFILGGLMMKTLVGDRLAAFIEVIDKSHADYSYSVMLTTVACYTLQLYADFSGYTNIALGIGKLFGVEGPPNFNAPFAAVNIQEMWRRWHMSLTLWLTDYLFTPLSMSLRDYGQAGIDRRDLPQHDHHRDLARLYAQFSCVRHASRCFSQRNCRNPWRACPPQARRRKVKASAGRNLDVAICFSVPRRPVDIHSHELLANLFPFPDMGGGRLHPQAGRRRRFERADELVGHAAQSHRSRLDLHGRRHLCRRGGAGRPVAGAAGRQGGAAMAAVWRLPVPVVGLVDRGKRTIRLRAILMGSGK